MSCKSRGRFDLEFFNPCPLTLQEMHSGSAPELSVNSQCISETASTATLEYSTIMRSPRMSINVLNS